MTAAPPPNAEGCRWCGVDRYGHAQRWTADVGWHPYEQPTTDQIHDRMRARLANRTPEHLRRN